MQKILPDTDATNTVDLSDLQYQEYARLGQRFASAILRNQSDAEEAVQESFFRMHKVYDELDATSYRAKFFKTLRNHCIDLIRRQRVRKEVPVHAEIENRGQLLNRTEANELNDALSNAVANLPENWRQALLLKTHGQLTYDEIAEATECTTAQIRSWIYRARRQLEETLVKDGILEPAAKSNE